MNAAIGKFLTQFDANGRAKSPPPPPPPKIQDVLTRKEIRREPQSQPQPQAQRQAQAQPQLQPPPAPAPEAAPVNLLEDAYRRGHTAGLAEGEPRSPRARPQRDPARRGAGQMVRPAGGRDRQRL